MNSCAPALVSRHSDTRNLIDPPCGHYPLEVAATIQAQKNRAFWPGFLVFWFDTSERVEHDVNAGGAERP